MKIVGGFGEVWGIIEIFCLSVCGLDVIVIMVEVVWLICKENFLKNLVGVDVLVLVIK